MYGSKDNTLMYYVGLSWMFGVSFLIVTCFSIFFLLENCTGSKLSFLNEKICGLWKEAVGFWRKKNTLKKWTVFIHA